MKPFDSKPYNPKLFWRAPGLSGIDTLFCSPVQRPPHTESPHKTLATLTEWIWAYIALWKVGKVAHSVKTEDWLNWLTVQSEPYQRLQRLVFPKIKWCSVQFAKVFLRCNLNETPHPISSESPLWSALPLESDWPLLNPECWIAPRYMVEVLGGILEAWQDCSLSYKCPWCIHKEGVGNVTCSRSVLSCGDYHPSDSIISGMPYSHHVPYHPT